MCSVNYETKPRSPLFSGGSPSETWQNQHDCLIPSYPVGCALLTKWCGVPSIVGCRCPQLAGADDYLTKPFDKGELRARLRVGTRILTLQEDLIRARENLRFQATHDVLTGIWNRRAVLDLLHREIERAARFHASTGVLMLDLDHFKKINDTYGHLTGDAVLKETAQRITQVVRSYDFVGRYGGEEFLVLLPGCDKEQAEQSGERIRLAVTATPVFAAGSEIHVTISIGATATIGGPETEVLAIADAALYQAKSAGRNRTVAS